MEYLYNEPVEIDSDSLFKIVDILINLDAEHHWLIKQELRIDRSKDNLFLIFFFDYLIGNVMIIPHNSLKSRVAVWVESLPPYTTEVKKDGNGKEYWIKVSKKYKTDLSDNEPLESVALRIMQRLAAGIRKELSPYSELHNNSYNSKGGPKATPLEDKLNYVRGWIANPGKITQEKYCKNKGIGASTLRSWMRDPEIKEKLLSS
jgi:hypothetical protein